MTRYLLLLFTILNCFSHTFAQNFTFNFNQNGQRVCLAESIYDINTNTIKVKLSDAASNTNKLSDIYRRSPGGNGNDWVQVATNLPAGTAEWTDNSVAAGNIYEYQIKRKNSWTYNSVTYDATGYTLGCANADNSGYQGQMILLVADNIPSDLSAKYAGLKRELTGEGWKVNELIVAKASSWNSGADVAAIRGQVAQIYNNAPADDKPKLLFILGHVPMPRSGSTSVTAPDAHDQNKGARGCDAYYADIDGVYTDLATYDPGGLQTPFAINLPNDYKWDQDFLPSEVEMGFGRVDFADITDYPESELVLIERYLDKLSNYRNVAAGFDMGSKTAFNFGYNNSNDASYRNLPNLSTSAQVFENTTALSHPQWVANNGPFMVYMQNEVAPSISEWNTYGMNATIYTSDQSYWGYNDVPQAGSEYSRIRALPASNTKCLVTIWTTAGANLFYQSCTGSPIGLALKDVINHNTVNNKIERPPQQWDTQDWWNRSHFTMNGDPTIRLYQVPPPSNVALSFGTGQAVLSWQAPAGSGYTYNVYASNEEFGKYNKVNAQPLTTLNFTITNYHAGNWYMVRAVKNMTSGCGSFQQPSLGIFTTSDIILSIDELQISLTAERAGVENLLKWQTGDKFVEEKFVVESSHDGKIFIEKGSIAAAENTFRYHYKERELEDLTNYYRIKAIGKTGLMTYSNVAKLVRDNNANPVNAYPNPTNGLLTIEAPFLIENIMIRNNSGKTVKVIEVHAKRNYMINMENLSAGIYFLQVNGKTDTEIIRVVMN